MVGLLFSCQKEDSVLIDENEDEAITANSVLTGLLIRGSEHAGDYDDIIDGNSCASVVLPATVIVNGQELIITSEDDFGLIDTIFNQFPNDDDTLEIVFPINIILENFTQVTINSQAELDTIIATCEGELDDAIGCVDFVYPITFYIYDSVQQQTGIISVNSDFEMYQFLSNLDIDKLISIDYPISLIVNGEDMEANNNQELLNIISNVDCDNDPIANARLIEDLTTGVWYITYYFDEYDETDLFTGYEFTFNIDSTAQATNGTNVVPGVWGTNSSLSYVDLDFGSDVPFNELYANWDIIEATSEIIRFKDVSGGNGSIDYLTFERTPNNGGSNDDLNSFIKHLTIDDWYVNLYKDDGVDETCNYVDYSFDFTTNGRVTATNISGGDIKNGFWTVEVDSNDELDLVLNFDYSGSDDPFQDLNDDWDVINFDGLFIDLEDLSGGNGGTDHLSFGRNPCTCCGGTGIAQLLRDIMADGCWSVQTYLEDGADETYYYTNYIFTFIAGGTVTADDFSGTIYGTWSVAEDSNGVYFVIDFGANFPLDKFNDDWDVLGFSETNVSLEDVSGGGSGTDNLVFDKIL